MIHVLAHISAGVVVLYISRHVASKHFGYMGLHVLASTAAQLLWFNPNMGVLFLNISDECVLLLLYYVL